VPITTGTQTTEFKVTAATAGIGALGVLIEMVRGGGAVSENVQMALLICITLIGISYVLGRGMAKYEYSTDGKSTAAPQPATNSEFKITAGLSGAGVLPLLLDMLKPGEHSISDKLTITIVACIAALVVSYNISRGLALYEQRGTPPPPPVAPGS
jgi:hypothetical protein